MSVPLDLTISPIEEGKPFLCPLRFSNWGPEQRHISKGKGRFVFTYVHRTSEKIVTQGGRIWGLYTILIKEAEGERGHYRKTDDF